MAEETTTLNFHELLGELRELAGRVVALEVRDGDANLVVQAEGEFGHLHEDAGRCSFQLGGDTPPEREGLRFILGSCAVFHVDRDVGARRTSTGIGAPFVLRISTNAGRRIDLWPAMPPEEQWTDRHGQNR